MPFVHLNCVIACVALIIIGAYGISMHSNVKQTINIVGKIIDVDRALNEIYEIIESRATVEYTIEDVLYTCVVKTSTTSNIFKGDLLDLVCDPSKPNDAFIEPLMSQSALSWTMLAVGVILLASKAL
jgi:hypothetical protein